MQRFFPAPLPATLRLLQKDSTFTDVRADDDDNDRDNPDRVDDARPTTRAQHDLAVAYRTYTDTHPQGRLANLGEWWGAFELGAADEVEERDENGQEEGRVGQGAGSGGKNGVAKKRKRGGVDRGGSGDSEAEAEEDEDEKSSEDDDESEDDEGPERRKQARFLRAVGDLAHLGFIHPTTYKAEHVLKSVY